MNPEDAERLGQIMAAIEAQLGRLAGAQERTAEAQERTNEILERISNRVSDWPIRQIAGALRGN